MFNGEPLMEELQTQLTELQIKIEHLWGRL